jgi:hypothetical protein
MKKKSFLVFGKMSDGKGIKFVFYLMSMAVCRMAALASKGTPSTERITR